MMILYSLGASPQGFKKVLEAQVVVEPQGVKINVPLHIEEVTSREEFIERVSKLAGDLFDAAKKVEAKA